MNKFLKYFKYLLMKKYCFIQIFLSNSFVYPLHRLYVTAWANPRGTQSPLGF